MDGDNTTETAEKPKPNIRHEWYQTESSVIVTVLQRDLKPDDVTVNLSEASVSVQIKIDDDEPFTLGLRLAHRIVPAKSGFKIMKTKLEIKLLKNEGIQWTSLEGDASENVPKQITSETGTSSGPPKYPTSNPSHRDWNAIEKDILKEMANEKMEGEDGVNQLFQKIYGEGSDEVKRAMNKSYLESGGTVLSTNWKEISKEKVPIKPPDGMEWKQWH